MRQRSNPTLEQTNIVLKFSIIGADVHDKGRRAVYKIYILCKLLLHQIHWNFWKLSIGQVFQTFNFKFVFEILHYRVLCVIGADVHNKWRRVVYKICIFSKLLLHQIHWNYWKLSKLSTPVPCILQFLGLVKSRIRRILHYPCGCSRQREACSL